MRHPRGRTPLTSLLANFVYNCLHRRDVDVAMDDAHSAYHGGAGSRDARGFEEDFVEVCLTNLFTVGKRGT